MTIATLKKGEHLIWAGLQFLRFNPLSSWQKSWWYAGRHDAAEDLRVLHVYPQAT